MLTANRSGYETAKAAGAPGKFVRIGGEPERIGGTRAAHKKIIRKMKPKLKDS
jgi:hypothetical protein